MSYSRRQVIRAAGYSFATAGIAGVPILRAEAASPPSERLPKQLADTDVEEATIAEPDQPDRRVGYAIVGLGRLSLEQIIPGFAQTRHSRISAVVTGDQAKGNRIASEIGLKPGSVYDYKNYDRIRDNSDIDAVYIVLPNGMHHEFTIRAAAAGKHVLCEKPMANSVAEAEDMIAACRKASRKLMIAYRMQYEPYNRMAIDFFRTRKFGAPKLLEATNNQNMDNPEQWRLKKALSGGGSLPDVGVYCLNASRYLSGEEPTEISAQIFTTPGDPRFREVEESVSFQLRYPSGFLATCLTSYGTHRAQQYRLHFDGAWVDMDPAFAYSGLRMRIAHKGQDNHEYIEEVMLDQKSQFAREIDHFSQAVRQDFTPHTPGEEGLQDIKLIASIYEAARTGKTVRLAKSDGLDIYRGPAPQD